ncbi:MAG: hypothetical protein AAF415_20795 [Pseudomonadota bacterium]
MQGDQYCSLWPPQEVWVCHDVAADPANATELFWLGESGARYVGKVIDSPLLLRRPLVQGGPSP